MAGCTNHYCWINGKQTGQCTNSGCACLQPLGKVNALALTRRIQAYEMRIRELEEACDRLVRSRNELITRIEEIEC